MILVGVFLLGVAVDLYFGRQGFLPLDQSVVFDGGWRMLSGQMPFRDFTAPSGIVPSAMQVPFFRLFGVTWFALCLHAAVVNGLFCVAVYACLTLCGATRWEATVFAALSAFFFYPPTGTPFTDQHSFFFTALMFLAAAAGTRAEVAWHERLAWFCVPVLFALGFLSCQIPAAFAAVWIAGWVALNPRRAAGWIASMAAGALTVALLLAALSLTMRIDLRSAFEHVVLTPLVQGSVRTPNPGLLAPLRMILGTVWRLPIWAHLWSLDLAIAALLVVPIASRRDSDWRLHLWALAGLILTTGAFVAYSKTQIDAGLGLAMLIAGIGAIVIRYAVDGVDASPAVRRRLHVLAAAAIVFVAARDTLRFVQTVDMPGSVHKEFDEREAVAAEGRLPPGLAFMRWSRGPSRYEADELAALVQYLRGANGDFLLIGDSSVLYGLTGKQSSNPALWFDPGLTLPRHESAEFAQFESRLLDRIRALDVRRVVVEGPRTWTGITLDDFPRLKHMTVARACGERLFGEVRVLEMCTDS